MRLLPHGVTVQTHEAPNHQFPLRSFLYNKPVHPCCLDRIGGVASILPYALGISYPDFAIDKFLAVIVSLPRTWLGLCPFRQHAVAPDRDCARCFPHPQPGAARAPVFTGCPWLSSLQLALEFGCFFYLPLIRSSALIVWFYRGMGARIGAGTVIATTRLWDCNLIEIGENCMIGGNASIAAHMINGERGRLRRVRIGSRVTIGANSSVMPGAIIEDDVVVGANSLVLQGMKLKSGGVYLGVPVRRVNEAPGMGPSA